MRLLLPALLGACSLLIAGFAPAERIGFVELRFSPGGVEVVSAESVPGQLKRRRSQTAPPPGHLGVEVEAGDRVVWSGAVPDPLAQRREYVDASGALTSRLERVDEATVTVRIPAVAARQTVAFHRHTEDGRTLVTRVEVSL